MNYGEIKRCDITNGPGVRVSLFVSGCPHHCKGCFNAVTWDYTYGKEFTGETFNYIVEHLKESYISGFTVLGGEPLAPKNIRKVSSLIVALRRLFPDLSIWVYTGYTWEDVLAWSDDNYHDRQVRIATIGLLGAIDVLVDGPYIESKRNLMLKYRGSENQRLINVQQSLTDDQIVLWEG